MGQPRRLHVLYRHLTGSSSGDAWPSTSSKQLTGGASSSNTEAWDSTSTKDLAVSVSNRHVHLTDADVAVLFGEGYKLTFRAGLAGLPTEVAKAAGYACEETVDVVNPATGARIERVRILGPPRVATQIELAYTDCRSLGIEAPTRISGDTVGSASCRLVGPSGSAVDVPEGVIRAWRHVHMSPAQAGWLGVSDGSSVAIKVHSPMSSALLLDVLVRLIVLPEHMVRIMEEAGHRSPLNVHIDTDEGNACMLQDATECELFTYDPRDVCTLVSKVRTPVEVHYVGGKAPRNVRRRRAALGGELDPRDGGVFWGADGNARGTLAKPPGTS